MTYVYSLVTLAVLAIGGKVQAHEFWIHPPAFEVVPGDALVADLIVGTEFQGASNSYLPRNFERFEVISDGEARVVEGRLGDTPALDMGGLPEGLAVVVYESTETRLTWSTWDRFVAFVEHKDLGDIAAMQAARGLDQEDVREGYFRSAKSLVAVGDGDGSDTRVGLRTELVALANPYVDDVRDGLPVQLWLGDTPRANEQVELFEEAPDATITITLHRTDDAGIAMLPVQPGYRYMADAVALEAIDPVAERDPEWLTYWANLTFGVPAR